MKTLMIDMDNVITDGKIFNMIESRINRKIKEHDTYFLQELLEDKTDFYEELKNTDIYGDSELIKDCYEVLEKLNNVYDIYIVTSYIWDDEYEISGNNLKNKYKYLREKLPFISPEKYIFTTNKQLLRFDIAIDDRLVNLTGATTKILFDAWHNRKDELSNDIIRVTSWKEVEHLLLKDE